MAAAFSRPSAPALQQASQLTRRAAQLIGIVSCVLVLAFTTGEAVTNPASRFATMDALVHDGTFAIDRSVFRDTIDKVYVGGHYYSSKPPVLSTLGAGLYWMLNRTTGLSFRGPGQHWALYGLTVLLMLGSHLLLLVYGYRLLARWEPQPTVLLPAFAALALAYLGWGYATSLNNHSPAAALGLASFYHAYQARSGAGGRRDWLLAGAFAGLAPTIDLAALFVAAALGLYLLTYDWRATLRRFVPAALPALALHFALTYAVTGSLLPAYLRPELYHYAGSYWNAPGGMDALDEPKAVYLVNMLVGHHGVLTMTPLLVVALWSLAKSLRQGAERAAEARAVGGALIALVGFYAITTKNYGGDCVGFRWLIVVMPLLLIFVADWLREMRGRLATLTFALFFAVSEYHAIDALRGPWRTSSWQLLMQAWGLG
jgi:hypothetical protein